MPTSSPSSSWTREQDKQFERAIVAYRDDCPDRWHEVAAQVPGKSVEQVKHHYKLLVEDVSRIDSGFIQLPCYIGSSPDASTSYDHPNADGSTSHQERRKGIAWTEDEHRLFLLGLDKYGKGDWRGISRNFVVTRTPTQVASHAQKYFIRLNSMNKNRRRSSIHDITSVKTGGPASSSGPCPITGQPNRLPQPPPGVGIYGTVGNLDHVAYGVGAPPFSMSPVISVGHEPAIRRGTKSWQNK